MRARYDRFAEWYDAALGNAKLGHFNAEVAARLLGPGPGELVEVGCGGRVAAQRFQSDGWTVTGVDISEDQLRVARRRGTNGIRADAAQMPFDDATFDAAVSIGTHTDFDDFAGSVREVGRVVRPAGVFVYVGVHPCFVGPHVTYGDREIPLFHPGYRNIELSYDAPGISPEGPAGEGRRLASAARHLSAELSRCRLSA